MNTFKTLLAMAALAGSAYAVYVSIFEHPSDLPPEQVASELGFQPPVFSGPTVGPAPLPPMYSDDPAAPPGWGQPAAPAPAADGAYPAAPLGGSPYGAPGAPATSASAAPSGGAWADPFANSASPAATGAMPPAYAAPAAPNPFDSSNSAWATTAGAASSAALTPLERPAPSANVATPAPEGEMADESEEDLADVVQKHLDNNQLDEALKLLSPYYDWEPGTALPPEDAETLNELLDQLAGTVIYSREAWKPTTHYETRGGETLDQIADLVHTPVKLIAKVNGVTSPGPLPAGMKLKVIPGPFEAVVDLQQQRLTLRVAGLYAGRFPVSLGEAPPAPGEYVVRDKFENPAYNSQAGALPGGAPGNPLGAKWIDLGNGLAIHSLADDAQFTAVGGPGSVRVSSRDVEDLYDILAVGSRITVHAGSATPAVEPAVSAPSTIAGAPGMAAPPTYQDTGAPAYPTTPGFTPGYTAPAGGATPPGYSAPPSMAERPFAPGGDLR